LNKEKKECHRIRKGRLTDSERQKMEEHVVYTERILDKVHFNRKYQNVSRYAASHHEYLNGSGYPNHLTGEELELESRILAVVDIFDALTCVDRPYKKPLTKEKAISILLAMAEEGQLEGQVVSWLAEALEAVDIEVLRAQSMF